jgi:hypothetical protein
MSVKMEYTGQNPVASLKLRQPWYSFRIELRNDHMSRHSNPGVSRYDVGIRNEKLNLARGGAYGAEPLCELRLLLAQLGGQAIAEFL